MYTARRKRPVYCSEETLRSLPDYQRRFERRVQPVNRQIRKNQLIARRRAGMVGATVLLFATGLLWMSVSPPPALARLQDAALGLRLPSGSDDQADSSLFDTALSVYQVADTGHLALINTQHPLETNPALDDLVVVATLVPDNGTDQLLLTITLDAISDLFAAARDEQDNLFQMSPFFVASGHRSWDEQQWLYDNEPDKTLVQPPGSSEHHTGLAVDVSAVNVSTSKMGSSREGKWLASNAPRFGLVVRYPQGKQSVTGIAYEPWHLRYLGQPHATYCEKNDLTLEEYLALLKETGGYRMEIASTTYHVVYQKTADGIVNVPSNRDYTVSSDNTGGYIVTAWE